ncbi:hypothetical protein [Halopiger goleimassiliensis]|uniref:hypothetical protein n=1 Tax=Halopiger goleimassiliensis TaxID=1293048 RepID=UPI000B26C05A|nr:hypothetical protein [Halopiger goleimassiliensis]
MQPSQSTPGRTVQRYWDELSQSARVAVLLTIYGVIGVTLVFGLGLDGAAMGGWTGL